MQQIILESEELKQAKKVENYLFKIQYKPHEMAPLVSDPKKCVNQTIVEKDSDKSEKREKREKVERNVRKFKNQR